MYSYYRGIVGTELFKRIDTLEVASALKLQESCPRAALADDLPPQTPAKPD